MLNTSLRLQLIVFALVSASFTNVYITQPILPIIQQEFSVDLVMVSFTVSATILGIALANLPFGVLVDRLSIRPIILVGGLMVACGGLVAAMTDDFWLLVGARFWQGLFIPALTTCLVAYLAKSLPVDRLKVMMGYYVSATVMGGLGSRLLGGWVHPPLHWRYAFLSAAFMMLVATIIAYRSLPKEPDAVSSSRVPVSFLSLLKQTDILVIFFACAGSFAIFSSIFNYLPYRLGGEPFGLSTEWITLVYLVYIMGIFIGPVAGQFSQRFGSGYTLFLAVALFAFSLLMILLPYLWAVVLSLIGICAGFFAIHSSLVGALNSKLSSGQGRANALYVLFYYMGGWLGITAAGFMYGYQGWSGVILASMLLLVFPLWAAMNEHRLSRLADDE